MSYFTGKNLMRKIKEYGLEDFEEALNNFENYGIWADIEIRVDDVGLLEPTRIVVYSILHNHLLKGEFSVKMLAGHRVLEITRKSNDNIKTGVKVAKGAPQPTYETPAAGETSFDPDFKKRIFEDLPED